MRTPQNSSNKYISFRLAYTYRDYFVFTVLHVMQTRSSDENSVCPSVCLSHACIVTKRKKDLSRFLYHTKEHLS